MLYTVNKSPLMFNNLATLLRVAPSSSPILLYEDGVYAAAKGTAAQGLIEQTLSRHDVYALQADLDARGIKALVNGIRVIGFDGFVELVEQHHVVPWL
jgi:tRNA 2-thiouridine synthesizing protein B